jgi:hypothetical protein
MGDTLVFAKARCDHSVSWFRGPTAAKAAKSLLHHMYAPGTFCSSNEYPSNFHVVLSAVSICSVQD